MDTTQHALAEPSSRGTNLTLSWGLVNMNLKVFGGTADAATHRSQFSPAGNPVGYTNVDKTTGQPVTADQITKKALASDGATWVPLSDAELAQIFADTGLAAKSAATVDTLVPVEAIGTVYAVDSIGYLRAAPIKSGKASVPNPAMDKALALFLAALEHRGKAALVRIGEKWAAILPDGRFAKLCFAEAIRQAPPLATPDLSERELELALGIIDSIGEGLPVLHDDVGARIRAFVDAKAAGKAAPVAAPVAAEPEVIDLMAALEASVAAAKPAKRTKAAAA